VRTVGAKKGEGEGLAEYSKTEHELSQEVTERKLLSHNRDYKGTGECGTSHGTVHVGMLHYVNCQRSRVGRGKTRELEGKDGGVEGK